jgi:hypothetical protein
MRHRCCWRGGFTLTRAISCGTFFAAEIPPAASLNAAEFQRIGEGGVAQGMTEEKLVEILADESQGARPRCLLIHNSVTMHPSRPQNPGECHLYFAEGCHLYIAPTKMTQKVCSGKFDTLQSKSSEPFNRKVGYHQRLISSRLARSIASITMRGSPPRGGKAVLFAT